MAYRAQCTTEEKKYIVLTPRSRGGQPAEIDDVHGIVVTKTSGDGTSEIDPARPTAGFFAVSGTATGLTMYDVTIDGRKGSGEKFITTQVELDVIGPDAEAVEASEEPAVLK